MKLANQFLCASHNPKFWGKGHCGQNPIHATTPSIIATDSLVVNLDGEFGKLFGKTSTGNKLKGSLWAAGAAAHYYVDTKLLTIAPYVGGSYQNVTFQKAKGRGFTIDKTNVNNLRAIGGFAVLKPILLQKVTIIPEFTTNASYLVKSNASKIVVKNNNDVVISENSIKTPKSSFGVGSSVTIANDVIELTCGYERSFGGKYIAQTGYAKLRVNL